MSSDSKAERAGKPDARRSPTETKVDGDDLQVSRRQALLAMAGTTLSLGGAATAISTRDAASESSEPYPGFKGQVGRTFLESKPWWPPERRAPENAPNIVVVLLDDLGFSDLGCFGAEIETPNIDRLAAQGVRYTNYHSEPTCSPTRAALLTGINPHAVGFGVPTVPAGVSPGFPGYAWQLPDNAVTMAEALRDDGYATMAVGKWHLSRAIDVREFSSSTSWPTRRGFDRYYGHWGDTNAFQPEEIWSDEHIVETERYPDGYFYPEDLTSQAISMIRSVRQSDPDMPYFLYLAFSSPHAPMNAKQADLEKYRGRFDAGWDVIRQSRFERQKALGVIGVETRLPPPNSETGYEAPPWSGLSQKERELYARYMELNAAVIDNIDQCFGRLRAAIEQMGEWDNTIVIFTSDNGANREGFRQGSTQYGDLIFRVMQMQERGKAGGAQSESFEFDYQAYKAGLLGGPQTLSDYPQAWAMASNTPFRLYKASTFCGGHQVPFIFSWPKMVRSGGSVRTQYAHVTDIFPTVLDLTGTSWPAQRQGKKLKPMTGVSFAHTINTADAHSRHIEQYTESNGSRRYYRDGWAIVTLHRPMAKLDDREWQLFNLKDDPTEINDLAGKYPEKVKEMSQAWEKAAWANQVFPVSEGSGVIFLAHAPYEERYAKPLTLYQGSPTVAAWRARWLMEGRTFVVKTQFSYAEGNEGTLFKHGGQGGGYGVYVENGKLLFILNGYGRMTEISGGALAPGEYELDLLVKALQGYRWDIEMRLDGRLVASAADLPMLMSLAPIGGIDVGIDRRSPVSWRLFEKYGVFRYGGNIKSVRYEPGDWDPDMSPDVAERMRRAARQSHQPEQTSIY